MDRGSIWQTLTVTAFDLLVVGGGITGAGVAHEAARRGLRVLLAEQGDFACGTSSRSTKLVHGGLRYLRQFQLRLVREGVLERQRLLAMAPHLVRPQPFLFPVYRGDPDPLWMVRAGLTLYDWFAGARGLRRHQALNAAAARSAEPLLCARNLVGAARYHDAVTDDARLTLAVLRAAAAAGATLLNYAPVVAFTHNGDGRVSGAVLRDAETGVHATVACDRILNAAGPWLDQVRRLDDPAAPRRLRLTKGVHLAFARHRLPVAQAVVIRGPDGRLMFTVPAGAYTYAGTTDTDYQGDPGAVGIAAADVDYILRAVRRAFPDAGLGEADVHAAWAGVRPLIATPGARATAARPSEVSRDHQIFSGRSGLVSVGGGKLTTYRAMAVSIVDALFPHRRGPGRDVAAPLPGAPDPGAAATGDSDPGDVEAGAPARLSRLRGLPPAEVALLASRHGSETERVLTHLSPADRQDPPRLARLKAELRYAVHHEWARRLDDFLDRRAGELLFGPANGLDVAAALAAEMGALLGWGPSRVQAEVSAYRERVAAMLHWRGEPGFDGA